MSSITFAEGMTDIYDTLLDRVGRMDREDSHGVRTMDLAVSALLVELTKGGHICGHCLCEGMLEVLESVAIDSGIHSTNPPPEGIH